MTEITIVGLGAMGSALAGAFLGAGHATTVWNRTSSKMDPLLALGANGAASISAAVEAAPLLGHERPSSGLHVRQRRTGPAVRLVR